jgi:hypothetical protein
MFSPAESEEESDLGAIVEEPEEISDDEDDKGVSRPPLMHTKSDTHITRWGPSRAFRKDSPPRIVPSSPQKRGRLIPVHSGTNLQGYFSSPSSSQNRDGKARVPSPSSGKKKHISFNTFVQQCIAIEKPKKPSSAYHGTADWYALFFCAVITLLTVGQVQRG